MKVQQPFFVFPKGVQKADQLSRFLKGLSLGEVLSARVLEPAGKGQAIVELAGHVLTAKCAFGFEQGALLKVQVAALWPEVLLKVVKHGQEVRPLIRESLMEALTQLLQKEEKDAGELMRFIDGPNPRDARKGGAPEPETRTLAYVSAEAPEDEAGVRSFIRTLARGALLEAETVKDLGRGRVLMRLGGRNVIARGAAPVEPGASFKVEVAATEPELVFRVADSGPEPASLLKEGLFKALARLAPEGPGKVASLVRFLRGLSPGEVLQARVVEPLGEGKALLEVDGCLIVAQCPPQLGSDTSFRLQVASGWPEILFRVLTQARETEPILRAGLFRALGLVGEDGVPGLLKDAAGEWAALDGAREPGAKDLSSLLDQLSLRPGSWDVKRYLGASGLLLESKLASLALGSPGTNTPWPDLKASLLQLAAALAGAGEPSGATRELLGFVEGCQSLAAASRGQEAQLFLPLVLWGLNRGDYGDLTVRKDGKGGDGGEVWSVYLRLDLKTLGRVLIHMVLKHRGLNCLIKAESSATESLFKKELGRLHERLEAQGVKRVKLRTAPLSSKDEWRELALRVPEGLLDMRA